MNFLCSGVHSFRIFLVFNFHALVSQVYMNILRLLINQVLSWEHLWLFCLVAVDHSLETAQEHHFVKLEKMTAPIAIWGRGMRGTVPPILQIFGLPQNLVESLEIQAKFSSKSTGIRAKKRSPPPSKWCHTLTVCENLVYSQGGEKICIQGRHSTSSLHYF